VTTNKLRRNPKNIKIEKILGNIFISRKVSITSATDMAVPTINNLGKKVLKKICEDSFVNTLNTTGDTKAMNEIMIPNKVDAKKLIITQLP
jgi:hypothetical protein